MLQCTKKGDCWLQPHTKKGVQYRKLSFLPWFQNIFRFLCWSHCELKKPFSHMPSIYRLMILITLHCFSWQEVIQCQMKWKNNHEIKNLEQGGWSLSGGTVPELTWGNTSIRMVSDPVKIQIMYLLDTCLQFYCYIIVLSVCMQDIAVMSKPWKVGTIPMLFTDHDRGTDYCNDDTITVDFTNCKDAFRVVT
jgi:hypothetical protein